METVESLEEIRRILKIFEDGRHGGRGGYCPSSMLRAFILKHLTNTRYNVGLIELLRQSPALRELCGFIGKPQARSRRMCEPCRDKNRVARGSGARRMVCRCRKQGVVPSEATFSRFFRRLLEWKEVIEGAAESVSDLTCRYIPDFGKIVIVDSTDIEAHGDPNRSVPADKDAAWGVRTKNKRTEPPKRKHERKPSKDLPRLPDSEEYFYGYKLHTIVDRATWIPIASVVLPANVSDTIILRILYRKAQERFPWFCPEYLIADRGYDSNDNHVFLWARGTTPVIHIRKSSQGTLHDDTYTTMGAPTCFGEQEMVYAGTSPETGMHLYRCPPGGCTLLGKPSGFSSCRDAHWEDPQVNPRIIGYLPRASVLWEELYAMRSDIERHFSSLKRSRLLDSHLYLCIEKVSLHVALAQLAYAMTVLNGDSDRIRLMAIRLRGE